MAGGVIAAIAATRGRGTRRLGAAPLLPVIVVAALALGAVDRPIRPVVLLVLALAYAFSGGRGQRNLTLAAGLPVAAILAWGAIQQPAAVPDASQCMDLVAPPAVWRFLEALAGLSVAGILVVERGASLAELGLRAASRRITIVAVVGAILVGPVALIVATWLGSGLLGSSFFGTYQLDLSRLGALLPALVFAISNAVAEELAYRGALMRWLAPSVGIVGGNLGQAIVFGLAHTGADFVGPEAPTAFAMMLTGFIGGVAARRTNSLVLNIAIHAAADLPIYYFWACRLA
jgi:membrane protease YdiL (CAAX protease family)